MPTEDIASAAAAAEEGPRHAAPRKTLLQRLHMPVGKAIALAAMPSAALMGMGFTSPLAKADPQPENPFRGESCVAVPDGEHPGEEPESPEEEPTGEPEPPEEEAEQPPEEEPDPEPEEETDGTGEPAEEAAGGTAETGGGGEEAERAEGAEGAAEPDEAAGEATEAEEGPAEAGEAEEEPAEGEFDPRDPLGLGQGLADLGDGLEDLLTPGRRDEEQPEEPVAPEEPEDPEDPEEPEQPADEEPAPPREDTAEESREDTPEGEPAEDSAGENEGAGDEDEDAAGDENAAEDAAEEESTDGAGEDAADPFAPDAQGREPFPCPVEESVPGTGEQTPITLPNDPWYLEATYLTLAGLQYHGVVNVTTADGSTKQVLKFTAEKVDIGDLHQIVDNQGGVRTHVATAEGSNSTFRDGTVTMYTERLEGNLFGVIPIVFDPEHQPPLDLPVVHFTDVFVTQAGQFGGTLTMQGMNIYHTHDGPTAPPA